MVNKVTFVGFKGGGLPSPGSAPDVGNMVSRKFTFNLEGRGHSSFHVFPNYVHVND